MHLFPSLKVNVVQRIAYLFCTVYVSTMCILYIYFLFRVKSGDERCHETPVYLKHLVLDATSNGIELLSYNLTFREIEVVRSFS